MRELRDLLLGTNSIPTSPFHIILMDMFKGSHFFIHTLFEQFDSNKIKAFAIAYDVIVTDPENGRKSDALLVDMTHKEDINIPVY